ncbi:MAG: hypothetical protein R3F60_21000 [bacterium]
MTTLTRIAQAALAFSLLGFASQALAASEIGRGWCYDTTQSRVLLDNADAILAWQADGNLVVYNRMLCANPAAGSGCNSAAAVWATGTGSIGRNLCFQSDGNLVVYGANGPVWASGTEGTVFKTNSGNYLRVNPTNGAVDAGGGGDGFHQRFDLFLAPGTTNSWGLRTPNNGYWVTAQNGGGSTVFATRPFAAGIYNWEQWRIEGNGDGSVYIRAYNNYFLRAENGGGAGVMADRTTVGPHERFFRYEINKMALKNCTLSLETAENTWFRAGDCATNAPVLGPAAQGQGFGNNNFGSGWSARMGYQTPYSTYTRTIGEGSVYGRLFGHQLTLFAAEGSASARDGVLSATARFTVMGVSIPVSLPDVAIVANLVEPIEKEYFKRSTIVTVVAVPVTVEAKAVGMIGIEGRMGLTNGLTAQIGPFARLNATVSAAVGAGCVRAGIEGTITLLGIELPLKAVLYPNARQVALTSALEISSLSGSISIFAQACLVGVEVSLGSWEGLTHEIPLANATYGF